MIYHVEGHFEGDIEADSEEQAKALFDEFSIESLHISIVYAVEEEE